ncbi:autotransporter domain-containing protein [Chthoniobacter flavus]|uniref:autotransporter domain-containing protein n=1 Tax=Chthoniobacter flavus TaxID=191863 RepID=UPI001404ACB6|nr:autotransporter domain-containing protein [Chthoniobacter flavus]
MRRGHRVLAGSIAALVASLALTSGLPRAAAAPPATFWLGETDGTWTGNNWATNSAGTVTISIPTAADDVTFSATGAANQGVTTLGQNFTIHSLTIADPTPVVINSGIGGPYTLTVAGNAGTGITASTGTNLTVNANLTLGGASDTIATNGTATVTITGTLSGSNGLVKNGAGTLNLAGNNAYTGATTVNAGVLQLSSVSPLPGAVNLAGSTAQLVLPGSQPGGLLGQYYNTPPLSNNGNGGDLSFGSLAALETHLGTLTPSLTANSSLAGTNFDFSTTGSLFPAPYNSNANNLEVEWSGQFLAQTAGSYTFGTASDDGSMLFIDGNTIVNNNFFQGVTERSGSVTLTQGLHDITIAFYQGGGGYGLQAFYTVPGAPSQTPLPNSLLFAPHSNVSIGSLSGVAGSQVVLNGATLNVQEDVDTIFAGTIVDGSATGGGLLKAGPGTLTLTGTNTYTGLTTIIAGTLQLGNGGNTGSILGDVADNAALVFNRSDDFAFAGNITGSGTVTKLNANTLTITGNFANTGGTTIAGTLQVGNGGTSGGLGGTVTNNGAIVFDRSDDNTVSANIGGTGTVTKLGANTLTLSGNNTYTGVTTVQDGTVQLAPSSPAGTASLSGPVNLASATARLSLSSGSGLLGSYYDVPNTPSDSNFTSLAALQSHFGSMTPTVVASSSLAGANFDFGTSVGQNFPAPYNSGTAANFEAEYIGKFDALTAGTYGFEIASDDASALYIDGQLVESYLGIHAFGGSFNNVTLTAGEHDILIAYYQASFGYGLQGYYIAPGGGFTLLPNSLLSFQTQNSIGALTGVAGSQVVLNGQQLTVHEDVDSTFAGAIVDGNQTGGIFIKDGVATLTLTGASTFTGSTTVAAGTLQIGDGVAAGASLGSSAVTTNSGATLVLNLLNGETFGNAVTNNGHVVATATSAINNYTLSGAMSGTGDFTKDGDNIVTLTGANTFTGGTTINAGKLQIGDGGTSGSLTGNVVNNSALFFNRSDDNTFSGNISGAGIVTKLGANVLTFSGNNTYTGTTTIQAGTLLLQANGANTTQNLSGAVKLTGSTATLALGSLSGLTGQYYNASPNPNDFTSLAALQSHLSTLTPVLTANSNLAGANFDFGTNGSGFPAPYNSGAINLEVEWTGVFNAQTAGTYSFFTASDDGSMLFIDGNVVVNNNNFQGVTEQNGTVDLTAGYHDIVIAFYQGGGGYGLNASYTPPGGSKTLLPNSAFQLITNATIGSLSGVVGSQIVLNGGQLTVNQTSSDLFAGVISDGSIAGGQLVKTGTAALTLSGANTYTGGTTVNAGGLIATNTSGSATGTGAVIVNSGAALGGNGIISGPVMLKSGGFVVPGIVTPGTPGSTLHGASLTWDGGGTVALQFGGAAVDQLALTGALTKGAPGAYNLELINTGIPLQQAYTLATFASTDFLASDFTLTLPAGYSAALIETGTSLSIGLAYAGGGSTIQNAAPVGTPFFADFIVTGSTTTGGPADNNTINSLTFTTGGSLTITNTLTVTSGNVTTTGTNTITGGTLFGPNGLHFDVHGNLFIGSTLIGNATLTGGGSLFLDGALFGNMNVLQGLLGGNGTIFGNLYNSSVVSPGHSPGQIHMTGNFAQSPSGLLQIQIGGRDLTQHDLLSVDGTASLAGALQLIRLDGFKLKRNKPVTFLTANGGVDGRFAMVENGFTSDTILEPTVVYHTNSVALEAVQGSFAAYAENAGLTPNQRSVARALDSAANDRHANALFDYLDYRKLSDLPRAFDKIAPDELTSMFTIGVSLANVQSGNIQRRNDDIRSGSAGFNAAGLALNGAGPSYSGSFSGVAGPSGDDGKQSKEVQQVAPADTRWGAFLSGTGEWVSVGNTDNARGYTIDSGGFTLGLDYKVTPNLAIGVAAGYTGTTADLTEGGRVYVNGGKIGLYATYYEYQQVKAAPTMSKDAAKEGLTPTYAEARGFYADAAVFGGYNSYHTHRAALQDDATGDTDGGELNVLFGGGYDFRQGNFTFGPTASFSYTYLGTNAFTEHGSLAPLDIHGGKGESLRTAFGIKASYDWKVGGVLIKPEIRAAWQHEYGDTAYSLDSSFANGAGDSFRVAGPQLGRDSALLGAGFAIQCSERCSTYFYYDGELGRRNFQSTSVTGGFRLAF